MEVGDGEEGKFGDEVAGASVPTLVRSVAVKGEE